MQVYRKPFNDTMLPSRTFFHIPSGSAAETVRDKVVMPSVSDGKLTQLLMAFSTFYREIVVYRVQNTNTCLTRPQRWSYICYMLHSVIALVPQAIMRNLSPLWCLVYKSLGLNKVRYFKSNIKKLSQRGSSRELYFAIYIL